MNSKKIKMKIINTRLHGIIDYCTALALVIPWITDYFPASEDTWILAATGSLIFLYSIITNYEFGLLKVIPMKTHLALDIFISLFLIACPFIFALPHYTKWPLILGVMGLIVTILSTPVPYKITARDLDITKPDI
jgi:hypothetical protein